MASGATLTHCFVLIDKWPALLRVTLEAGFVSAQEGQSAGFKPLLHVCRGALGRDPFVRFMAITAAHLAFKHRVMMRQLECRADLQVTLETSVRRLSRIDDRTSAAAGLNVQTPGPVARLAAHVLCVFSFRLQSRVSGCPEVAHDLFVACCAFF